MNIQMPMCKLQIQHFFTVLMFNTIEEVDCTDLDSQQRFPAIPPRLSTEARSV